MAEDNAFGKEGITERQKQEMYETMVIYPMRVQAAQANQTEISPGLRQDIRVTKEIGPASATLFIIGGGEA